MRLNQYISHNTKYSRREADALIEGGRVNLDREKATPNSIYSGQKVFIDGKLIKERTSEAYTFIIYNKPKGEIVSKNDDRGRKTIFDALGKKAIGMRSVGRLDFSTTGLIILGDDVNIINTLETSNLPRAYIVRFYGKLSKEMIEAMEAGLHIEGKAGAHKLNDIETMYIAPFVDYKIISEEGKSTKLKITISEGKNREIRRFFAHFGKEVDIRRVSFGFLSLNNLPEGKSRYFTTKEYEELREFLAENEKYKTAREKISNTKPKFKRRNNDNRRKF